MQTLNELSPQTMRNAILGMLAELFFAACIIIGLALLTFILFKALV